MKRKKQEKMQIYGKSKFDQFDQQKNEKAAIEAPLGSKYHLNIQEFEPPTAGADKKYQRWRYLLTKISRVGENGEIEATLLQAE